MRGGAIVQIWYGQFFGQRVLYCPDNKKESFKSYHAKVARNRKCLTLDVLQNT